MILRYRKNKFILKCFVKIMLHLFVFIHDPYLKIQKIQSEKIYNSDEKTVKYINYYVYIESEKKNVLNSCFFSVESKKRLCF